MKNRLFFALIFIVIFSSSCQFNEHQAIKNYELSLNQLQVESIDSKELFVPFYAHDSIRILELEYNLVITEKLKSIENQMEYVRLKIQHTERELETIENPLMVAAVKSRIKLMILEQNKLDTILSIYQKTPENTQLVLITNRINYLTMCRDTLLGYTLKVTFIGKQGALPVESYQRNYLFNCRKNCVLGVFQE